MDCVNPEFMDVLVIDDPRVSWFYPSDDVIHPKAEIFEEIEARTNWPYEANNPALVAFMRTYGNPCFPDNIVIGNNVGTGISYAKLVPEEFRKDVIIAFNTELAEKHAQQYRELGITQFVRRENLRNYILSLYSE